MDISSISSMYSDIYASSSSQSASKLQNKLDADHSQASNEELMDVCKEFEAYFLEQMFKEMMKTIPENEENSGSMSNMMDYYKDEMVKNGSGSYLAKIKALGDSLTCDDSDYSSASALTVFDIEKYQTI